MPTLDPTPHSKGLAIFTTGGTIVSSGDSATQMTGYSIRGFDTTAFLECLKPLEVIKDIKIKMIAEIDSSSMTSAIWMDLARAIEEADQDPDIDGMVITHGTDTLEETAYFLSLVLKTSKPVVLTGAMRPSTAMSADGPLNLYNAARVALDEQSRGKGVLVVLNDTILSARDATKMHPTNVATFVAPNGGALGLIAGESILWLSAPVRHHNPEAPFPLERIERYLTHHKAFPRVDILYTHVDDDAVLVNAVRAAGAQGIVHAGSGNGSIHENTEAALFEAAQAGVLIVRASRTPTGATVNGLSAWQEAGFVPSGTLNPQKARVLAQLILMFSDDAQDPHSRYTELTRLAQIAFATC